MVFPTSQRISGWCRIALLDGRAVGTFGDLIDLYESAAEPSQSDRDVLNVVRKAVSSVSVRLLSYGWVEGWVAALKGLGYAPSTLKKRVEFLARVVDWAIRTEKVAVATNPLRMLPKGYASKGVDKEKLWAGERDRRLEQPEEGAIRKVLVKKEEHLIFDMALETAMRMGEMVTLKWGQIDLRQKTIFLDKTKNGSKRQVPISSVLMKELAHAMSQPDDMPVFPLFWDGIEDKVRATNRVSTRFGARFAKAGCPDLRFHDLRHEATCGKPSFPLSPRAVCP